ncbi:hypothetical protein [Sandaracinus amylolyticus]|uniref:Copper type II ascorbate-dependent monooxygenase C-terminal domain-containing protein n=1 Tax=Sandaracinus amylolyticus TaxID=927083 RepID=A0A0F6YH59_9BACT|nr:hypothetical protein [Sandaracinus amylolyticus]AKF03628.1 hypothetical protein DB32_000777 [Sandaracinus amylolyticus]
MRALAPLAIVIVLFGCGSSRTSGVDGGNQSDAATADSGTVVGTDAGPVDPGAPSATVSFGPHPLGVGDERTVCVILDAGNPVARQVRAIRTHLPQGSHHMIVYRTDMPVRETPYPCFPFADGGEAVFIAETVEAELVYPEDAALEFSAHQHIRLEIHEINYTREPIDVRSSVTFEFHPPDAPPRAPVEFLFTGNMSLTLPPRRETTVTSFHGVRDGARIFALTSHTHSLGTYAAIHRARSETDFDTPPLHESTEWAEPPLNTFGPPLVLDPDEGLRLTCTYFNDRADTVSFGLDFEDEMCFLWAYYY